MFFRQYILFIEAKNVKKRNKKKQRKDAEKQFKSTIPYYLRLYPKIETMKLKVIMNFKSNLKIPRTSSQVRKLYFKETFNAEYIETNVIEFK